MMPVTLRTCLRTFSLLPTVLLLSCSEPEPRDLDLVADALYTTVTIKIPGGAGDPEAAEGVRAAVAEMRRVEKLLNYYDPESTISRLNRERELARAEMGEEVWDFLERCREIWEETGGAFDVSVGPLISLWGIGTDEQRVPAAAEIEAATHRIGLDKVVWETDQIRLPEGMELHPGGILKGYALDRAAAVLRQRKIRSALLNAGGDIFALGERAPGVKWRVGIRHPRSTDGHFGRIEIADAAVASSGDYMQFYEVDGKRYHHILDPRTGRPSEACVSATVVAREAVRADGWATAAVVLGAETGARLERAASSGDKVEYLLVLPSGEVVRSPGFPAASELPSVLSW